MPETDGPFRRAQATSPEAITSAASILLQAYGQVVESLNMSNGDSLMVLNTIVTNLILPMFDDAAEIALQSTGGDKIAALTSRHFLKTTVCITMLANLLSPTERINERPPEYIEKFLEVVEEKLKEMVFSAETEHLRTG